VDILGIVGIALNVIILIGGFVVTSMISISKNEEKLKSLKSYFSLEVSNIKSHIEKLELKQDESNKIKERLAIMESTCSIFRDKCKD